MQVDRTRPKVLAGILESISSTKSCERWDIIIVSLVIFYLDVQTEKMKISYLEEEMSSFSFPKYYYFISSTKGKTLVIYMVSIVLKITNRHNILEYSNPLLGYFKLIFNIIEINNKRIKTLGER